MCEICRSAPCRARCPNHPPLIRYGECSRCGKELYIGDTVTELDDRFYCEACIAGNTYTARQEDEEEMR